MAAVDLLGIVPVRRGSKGIPRKNLRSVRGRPLFLWTVDAVQSAAICSRLVVSTDDVDIADAAEVHGVEVIWRDPANANDHATISDVALEVVEKLTWSGAVGIFQVTSPLRSAQAIRDAFDCFCELELDSLMSAYVLPHIAWLTESLDTAPHRAVEASPLFTSRANRQYSEAKVLVESGAIQFVDGRSLARGGSVVGDRHRLFVLDPTEALDIDTPLDLAAAEQLAQRSVAVFRVSANAMVGSGHVFQSMHLAAELWEFRSIFLLRDCDEFVGSLLSSYGFEWRIETGDLRDDVAGLHLDGAASVIVNDVLDTEEKDLLIQRACFDKVVCVEDLGAGPTLAHAVVNALYPPEQHGAGNVYTGSEWTLLRPEFFDRGPHTINGEVHRILLTFGGTDPGKLTERVAKLVADPAVVPGAEIRVVLGPGKQDFAPPDGVVVIREPDSMAVEMRNADLVFTSAGRTVLEAAAMGVPIVAIAQNLREATHSHLSLAKGVVFLGLASIVSDEEIVRTARQLAIDSVLRRDLSERLRAGIDLGGAGRLARLVRELVNDRVMDVDVGGRRV